jgi:hypothetical protein
MGVHGNAFHGFSLVFHWFPEQRFSRLFTATLFTAFHGNAFHGFPWVFTATLFMGFHWFSLVFHGFPKQRFSRLFTATMFTGFSTGFHGSGISQRFLTRTLSSLNVFNPGCSRLF